MENMNKSSRETIKRKLFTYLVMDVLLGISFYIVSKLYIFKEESHFTKKSSYGTYIGYSISAIIASINYIIRSNITVLCAYEGHRTHTAYYCSNFEKLVLAYFFNSALIIFFVCYKEMDIGGASGLIYNVLYIQFFAAFITPFLFYFDPSWGLKLLKQWYLRK
jgi:hypothetical protein